MIARIEALPAMKMYPSHRFTGPSERSDFLGEFLRLSIELPGGPTAHILAK